MPIIILSLQALSGRYSNPRPPLIPYPLDFHAPQLTAASVIQKKINVTRERSEAVDPYPDTHLIPTRPGAPAEVTTADMPVQTCPRSPSGGLVPG